MNLLLIYRSTRFLVNRGPNEVINGQQFNGSVRLFRRFSKIPQRGHFHCELPNAANPSVNQIIYINICKLILLRTHDNRLSSVLFCYYTVNFGSGFNVSHVIISSSDSNIVGAVYSLMCSSTLYNDSIPLPNNVPAPTFVWFFGPNGNNSLPSGVTDNIMGTTSSDNITFTSTLQFSPLSQCHIGKYTCRLGPARLATSNNIMVTVN